MKSIAWALALGLGVFCGELFAGNHDEAMDEGECGWYLAVLPAEIAELTEVSQSLYEARRENWPLRLSSEARAKVQQYFAGPGFDIPEEVSPGFVVRWLEDAIGSLEGANLLLWEIHGMGKGESRKGLCTNSSVMLQVGSSPDQTELFEMDDAVQYLQKLRDRLIRNTKVSAFHRSLLATYPNPAPQPLSDAYIDYLRNLLGMYGFGME